MTAGRAPNDTGQQSRRTAACDVAPHRTCRTVMSDADRNRTRRNAAVVIPDPRIVVVESATVADPAALDEVLELLVRWVVRARGRDHPALTDAPSDETSITYGQGN